MMMMMMMIMRYLEILNLRTAAGQGGSKRNPGYEISFCMDVWKVKKTTSPKYIGRWKRDFYRA
jgi:hypothetical protein